MTTKISNYLSTSAMGVVLALSSLPALAQGIAEENALEEIFVTAERRSESLQTVPVSVSAFTESEMERRQINSTLDIVRNVPNLIGSNNVGLSSATSLFMRGVGQDESLSAMDPAVGTYVDGVYITRQISNNAYLYDIERIEVLRGPQGTLYGRNTSGGAIKIVTRKPGEDFTAKAEASYGSFESYSVKGQVNAPISDNIFFNIAAFTAQRDKGFQKNITLGTRTYDEGSSGVRASLRARPSDNLDIVVTGEYAHQKDTGVTGSNLLGPNPDKLFVVQSGLQDSFNKIDQYALTANITWTGENSTWNSITGYRDLDHNFRIDFSDDPVPAFVIDQDGTHRQFSQEIQGSGSLGDFDWVLGGFYMKETNDNVRRDELFLFGGFIAADLVADFENDAESWAVFGQGSYHLTDQLSLSAGGRWTREEKTMDIVQSADIGGGILFPLWGNAELDALGISTKPVFKDFTPHVGIEYQVNDDLMTYASYTEGFKSGGWNARGTDPSDFNLIEAENAEAYEVGFKSEFMNNRVRLNGAYFRNTYKDFIITALNPDTGGFVTINAAEARISGIELELSARPAEGLDLYASLGRMWNKYTKLGDNVIFDIDNEIKRTPKYTAQVGFNYRAPVTENGAVILSADYSHQDKYYGGVNNSAAETSEATDLVHAAISYEGGDGQWSVTAACENCTDQEYHHSALDFGVLGFATQFPGERRIFSVRMKFVLN